MKEQANDEAVADGQRLCVGSERRAGSGGAAEGAALRVGAAPRGLQGRVREALEHGSPGNKNGLLTLDKYQHRCSYWITCGTDTSNGFGLQGRVREALEHGSPGTKNGFMRSESTLRIVNNLLDFVFLSPASFG
jgi:hypothetical protein